MGLDVAAPPAQGRLARHLRLLGIFWVAFSAVRLIGAGAVLTFGNVVENVMSGGRHGGWIMHGPMGGMGVEWVPRNLVPAILSLVGLCLLIGAIAGFAAGWGLLQRRRWARVLPLILGALALLDFPFGTALGVYTLWVLLPSRAEEEYGWMTRTT